MSGTQGAPDMCTCCGQPARRDTGHCGDCIGNRCPRCWDWDGDALSPEEAVREAAASAALAGQPVSQEWQERVLGAIQTPGGVDRLVRERIAELDQDDTPLCCLCGRKAATNDDLCVACRKTNPTQAPEDDEAVDPDPWLDELGPIGGGA